VRIHTPSKSIKKHSNIVAFIVLHKITKFYLELRSFIEDMIFQNLVLEIDFVKFFFYFLEFHSRFFRMSSIKDSKLTNNQTREFFIEK